MNPRDAESYLEFAYRTAIAAGDAILPHFREIIDVEDKRPLTGYDPVTIADRAAEEVIRAEIARAYPDHGIHGEEQGKQAGTSPLTWVIDPIDGTRSFILGQLHWATLIALHDGVRPVLGVVHQPFVGETFLAARGGLAQWRRGDQKRTLRTRNCARVEDAVVATTDPRHFKSPRQRAVYDAISGPARLTRFGGDCYCYTQLAMGFVDMVVETGLQPYDVQALIPLIEAAGGVITNWAGGPCDQGGDVFACGDSELHAKVLAQLA